MADNVVRYLLRRLFHLYPLSDKPTHRELLEVCRERGWPVFEFVGLGSGAYSSTSPRLGIALGINAPPRKLPHEMFYVWVFDNSQHGIEYRPPEWDEEDEGEAATRFEYGVMDGEECWPA